MFAKIKKFFSKPQPTVFNQPFDQLPMNQNGIPEFFEIICNQILAEVTSQGIFRKCGDQSRINLMGEKAMKPNFQIPPKSNVNDLTSFLKQWLRELPEPILTPSVVKQFYENSELSSTKVVIKHLKPANRKCLAILFSIVKEVTKNSEVNLMNLPNLFICFTPSLLQDKKCIDYGQNFSFDRFLENSMSLLNDTGTDFITLDFSIKTRTTSYNSTPSQNRKPTPNFGEVMFVNLPEQRNNQNYRFQTKIRSNSTKSCPLLSTLEVPGEDRTSKKHRKSFNDEKANEQSNIKPNENQNEIALHNRHEKVVVIIENANPTQEQIDNATKQQSTNPPPEENQNQNANTTQEEIKNQNENTTNEDNQNENTTNKDNQNENTTNEDNQNENTTNEDNQNANTTNEENENHDECTKDDENAEQEDNPKNEDVDHQNEIENSKQIETEEAHLTQEENPNEEEKQNESENEEEKQNESENEEEKQNESENEEVKDNDKSSDDDKSNDNEDQNENEKSSDDNN